MPSTPTPLIRRIPLALLVLFLIAGGLLAVAAIHGPAAPVSEPAPAPADFRRISIDVPTADQVAAEQRAAFLADLLGPDVGYSDAEAADLVHLAERVCDLLGDPTGVPAGAEIPTRDGITSGLIASGWTAGEAGKLVDTAVATYCAGVVVPAAPVLAGPAAAEPVQQPAPAPTRPSAAPAPARTVAPPAPAPAPVVEQPTPAVDTRAYLPPGAWSDAGPVGDVAEQLPEESIGGARCGDSADVVTSVTVDGAPVCGQP